MDYPKQGLSPTPEQVARHLRHCNEIAAHAVELGRHPFGAVLVGPDQETVLMTQCNVNTVDHAESVLARNASLNYSPGYLWSCTLYTTVEPCCMCAGTAYWANIGRIVFGMTEKQLMTLTGNHDENPTMDVSSSYVFDHCQKEVELIGPIPELVEEIAERHRSFWQRD